MKSLTLMLTEKCNCECKYCYQKQIKTTKKINENDWGKQNLDFFKNIFQQIKVLHFFGGEPLLMEDLIIKIDKFLDENDINKPLYVFSTNLTYLSEKFKIFLDTLKSNKYKFKIITSIDGNRFVHDKNRLLKNNKSSYELIKENYDYLISKNYEIENIVAVYNKEHLNENITILETIESLTNNFSEVDTIQISCDFLSKNLKIDKSKFRKKFLKSIQIIFDKAKTKDLTFIKYTKFLKRLIYEIISIENDISNIMCASKNNRITIFPNGDIFTCPDEYYHNELKLGNIYADTPTKDYFLLYSKNNLKTLKHQLNCNKCNYSSFCNICPLIEDDKLIEECNYKKEFYFIMKKNLQDLFSDINSFLFFKQHINMTSQELKKVYTKILKIEDDNNEY